MEDIVTKYNVFTGEDEFKIFDNFYSHADLTLIKQYIHGKISDKSIKKLTHNANAYRMLGNTFYAKKHMKICLEFYTKALSSAIYNSPEYGMALGNRSAALIEQEDYLNALSDIELCLKSEYPKNKRSKIYLRKAECLYNLKMYDKLREFLSEMEIKEPLLTDKLAKFKDYKCDKSFNICTTVFPEVNNEKFASASSKIKLMYNEKKGRHVVANEDIKVGDLLFVEKAFAFAILFDEDDERPIKDICYNCLQQNTNCIPCKICVACMYCNEECRDSSWEAGHKFECNGMRLWYDLGLAFPALKCIFKGMKSNFKEYNKPLKDCTEQFGDTSDNYVYFNSLVSHLSKIKHMNLLVVTATTMILYLKNHTDFFKVLAKGNDCDIIREKNIKHIGGLLIRHMAQLSCNASGIQHWPTLVNTTGLIPKLVTKTQSLINMDEAKSTASGIFPSVSMMNHSCKPNICMIYVNDVVIVRASANIKKGKEIFNSYAIDYKSKPKAYRQKALKTNYFFKCRCSVCSNDAEEYETKFNSFICYHCKSRIATVTKQCNECKKNLNTNIYENFNLQFGFDLLDCQNIVKFEKHVQEMERILPEFHDRLFLYYEKLQSWFKKEGNAAKSMHYRKKALRVIGGSHGVNSWQYVDYIIEEYIPVSDEKLFNMLKLYYPVGEIKIIPRL